jgi:hypothetical protein
VIVNNSLQVTTQIVPIHMVLKIQVLAWDSIVWRGYINWLMGSPTDIHKQYKPAQIRYHSKSPHTIININDIMVKSIVFIDITQQVEQKGNNVIHHRTISSVVLYHSQWQNMEHYISVLSSFWIIISDEEDFAIPSM